ncbi:Pc20g14700 [Penicillium rubens Wisconsin 54-1255]|uniref:Pc20g14700 protein n=1 Tax=Penicillium rubens (strain ATCC 28089 / DSM 1075 / NRRL 1951 / Wisconsin 54-1255) TaxID=500485 RepID=B6HHF3_PENRW|nr:Pc20g14700 [Penicillium rubens Wisconsin 54-1255]
MSDMDREWKPKARPQSTMAQAFSSALDSAFMLDSDVNNLSQTIDQKKQQMLIQNRELEELQNRIREAERRLQSQTTGGDKTSSQTSRGQGQSAGERSI